MNDKKSQISVMNDIMNGIMTNKKGDNIVNDKNNCFKGICVPGFLVMNDIMNNKRSQL